jgi:RND family efflux transporter MFP subunit
MNPLLRRIFAVLTAAFALASVGCSHEDRHSVEASEAAESLQPVQLHKVSPSARSRSVRASGTVEGHETADLAFLVGGRTASVRVREGQRVAAGQLLATLEPTDYQLALDQALISKRRAGDEFVRMKYLSERSSIAPNDFEKYEAAALQAVTQERLARKHLEDTRLFAPYHGVITRRQLEPQENVAPGVAVLSLNAIDPVKVKVGVPEASIHAVHPGSAALVHLNALDRQPFAGRVTLVGVAADPATRMYTVEITVPNPKGAILPGMIAETTIESDSIAPMVTLPPEAVVQDADGAPQVYVYFPKEHRVYARRVTTGSFAGREIEITEGLVGGDYVVVGGQHRLREGVQVKATEGSPSQVASLASSSGGVR